MPAFCERTEELEEKRSVVLLEILLATTKALKLCLITMMLVTMKATLVYFDRSCYCSSKNKYPFVIQAHENVSPLNGK